MSPHCVLHSLPYLPDPSRYFQHVHAAPGAILLDSGRPGSERGRYDILSAWPRDTLMPQVGETGAAFFQRLRRSLSVLGSADVAGGRELPFAGGLMGYMSYDYGRRLEAPADGPPDDVGLPDARYGVYDWSLTSDHARQRSDLVFHPTCPEAERERLVRLFTRPPEPPAGKAFALDGPFSPTVDRETYRRAIERIQRYIAAGDCYQVNYTQRFQAPYRGAPWLAYQALRRACPTPFSGYIDLGGGSAILSLSPERFIRLSRGTIETRPIKGTRPRGRGATEDRRLAEELQASAKDRAENLMIVDLLRNDIGRVSRTGSVRVPELFSLESYPNVHHLVSCVEAELAHGRDAFDLLAAGFPGGSITGAPKIRAMQIIDELEPRQRGVYCGSLLYVDVRGEMDSSIAIRSLVAHEGRIRCWGGGGIVMDSDWEDEYRESVGKVKVLMEALERMPDS